MKNWNHYKNKTYTQHEARKMDYELDIIHDLLANLYDIGECDQRIKETLDTISRRVHSKKRHETTDMA